VANVLEAFLKLHDQFSRPLRTVQVETRKTERDVRKLTREVNDLERHLQMLDRSTASPKIYAQTKKAEADLRRVRAEIEAIDKSRATIHIDANTRPAERALAGLAVKQRALERANKTMVVRPSISAAAIGVTGMASLAIPYLSAAIPLATQLGVAMGGLLPIMGAVASGFGLMLGTAIPFFKKTIEGYQEIKKAEKALAEADTAAERAKALEQLAEAQKKLSPIQRQLIAQTKALAAEWTKASAPLREVIGSFSVNMVKSARAALRGVAPAFKPFAAMFERQGNAIAQFFERPTQILMMRRLMVGWVPILESIGNSFGNLFRWLQAVTLAAQPLGLWMAKIFESWTNGIANRAEQNIEGLRQKFVGTIPTLKLIGGLIRDAWHGLIRIGKSVDIAPVIDSLRTAGGYLADYAVAVNQVIGPRLDETMRNIGELAITFLPPWREVAGFIIDSLNAIMGAFNALPYPIRKATAVVIGFGLAFKAMGILPIVTAGIKTLAAVLLINLAPALARAATSMGLFSTASLAAAATNPAGWMALAVTAAVGLGYGIYRLVKWLKNGVSEEERHTAALKRNKEAMDRAADAARNLSAARRGLERSELAADQAQLNLQQARLRLRQAKKGTFEWKQASLDVRQAEMDLRNALEDRSRQRARSRRAVREARLANSVSLLPMMHTAEQLQKLEERKKALGGAWYALGGKEGDKKIANLRTELSAQGIALLRNVNLSARQRREFLLMMKVLKDSKAPAKDLVETLGRALKNTPNLRRYSRQISQVLQNTNLTAKEKVDALNKILSGKMRPPDMSEWKANVLGAIGKARSAVQLLIQNLSNFATSSVGGWFFGKSAKPDRKATGGIYTSPSLAVFAERGPEAIVPLGPGYAQQRESILRRIGASSSTGGASVTINFGDVTISSGDDMDSFVAKIEDAIKRGLANTPHVDMTGMYA
jgi:hypothetical protein